MLGERGYKSIGVCGFLSALVGEAIFIPWQTYNVNDCSDVWFGVNGEFFIVDFKNWIRKDLFPMVDQSLE